MGKLKKRCILKKRSVYGKMYVLGEIMYKNYIKPSLDFIIALGLLIILLPLMIITIIVTIIDLGFPIYNRLREREGKNKKTFIMYKIRTKTKPTKANGYKEEYTKVSRIIDSFRLNEIPQLINVIKGDMSLVGPRPFIPGEELPEGRISEKRYKVRPGITGLAQVNGGRAITHKAKLRYDEIYYDNLSFKMDVKIILKTIYEVIFHKVDKK